MKFKLIILSLFVMFFFNACAPKNISPAKLKTISNIGVLSLHGNEMASLERGLTIFGNEDNITDITSWKIDEYIQKEMTNMLSSKYKITDVILTPFQNKEIDEEYEKRIAILKDIIVKNKLDALIIFEKGAIIYEHHDVHRGIGVIKAKTLGFESTYIKLNMNLISYDIVKDKVEQLHFNNIKFKKESLKLIENSLWVDTTKPLPIESIKVLEPIVKKMLRESLLKEFKEIGYL
ncbi:hypothetical protein LXN10_00835 [Arcobacter sp. KX21116]|uniref:hypothetical protein n=1 Tax=Arcobacter iocasae TaxID=2906515 RepID=UPI0035D50ADC